jgi:hypothetical protein
MRLLAEAREQLESPQLGTERIAKLRNLRALAPMAKTPAELVRELFRPLPRIARLAAGRRNGGVRPEPGVSGRRA